MKPRKVKTELEKLTADWYARLEEAGFYDWEDDRGQLKRYSHDFRRPERFRYILDQTEYYYMATHFLSEHKFETRLDQIIWEYHSNGLSLRDITKLLEQGKIKQTNRTTVGQVVRRLEKLMFKLYNVHNKVTS